MTKREYEELLEISMSTGADFAEIYHEASSSKSYDVINSKLDTIRTQNKQGIGLRIIKKNDCYYASTNNLSIKFLKKMAEKLAKNISKNHSNISIHLNEIDIRKQKVKISHDAFSSEKKKELLLNIDHQIRDKYSLVSQVSLRLIEDNKTFTIANTTGKYVQSSSCHTRFVSNIYTCKNDIKENESYRYGESAGYEFLDNFNPELESMKAAETAIAKLDAEDFKGGVMPVIIAPGFGAVIFHEACGHGLEATAVAPKLSVFSDLLGQKIGSDKVTIIDDGTISNAWGSSIIDDEGNETKKNILIENGVLKNYLVDQHSSTKMHCQSNGCGRREDYDYVPTSRMSNTYLAPGTDTFEEMLKSIKLGVYCEKLSGGTVNTSTGDFNFAVDTAHLIENGKITKMLRGITLIGNGKDILNNVEMVGSDLKLEDGYCGSKSGMIHVTVGQPTIKVSSILVGGRK